MFTLVMSQHREDEVDEVYYVMDSSSIDDIRQYLASLEENKEKALEYYNSCLCVVQKGTKSMFVATLGSLEKSIGRGYLILEH